MSFSIYADNLTWINDNKDDPEDLCLHGHAVVIIGNHKLENLSTILKRNDIKKSDAYQSGFLEGTTSMYDAYMRLKKSIAAALK